MLTQINLIVVLVAAVSGMALGAFWYSPAAFGNAWLQAIGRDADDLGPAGAAMAGSMLACLVSALALECLFVLTAAGGISGGLMLAAIAGFGLVATAIMSDALFSGWSLRLYLIQAGYRVSYLLLMGLVIGAWPRGA